MVLNLVYSATHFTIRRNQITHFHCSNITSHQTHKCNTSNASGEEQKKKRRSPIFRPKFKEQKKVLRSIGVHISTHNQVKSKIRSLCRKCPNRDPQVENHWFMTYRKLLCSKTSNYPPEILKFPTSGFFIYCIEIQHNGDRLTPRHTDMQGKNEKKQQVINRKIKSVNK